MNSGPILLFLVLEQGPQFASHTAVGSLLGILAWSAFTLAYAYACLRLNWWASMLIGWLAYFLVAGILLMVNMKVVPAYLLVVVALALTLWSFPRIAPTRGLSQYGKFDLVLRMASASFMVVMLTGFAQMLGPASSGLLSAFPAYTTILAVFSHRQNAAAAVHVLKGVAIGLYTAATFFLILAPGLLRLPATAAFTFAIIGALVVQAGSLILMRRPP